MNLLIQGTFGLPVKYTNPKQKNAIGQVQAYCVFKLN